MKLYYQAVPEAVTICPRPSKLTFDLLTLKVVSPMCDVGYFCASFSLPRPLCDQLRPDVCDRQTDVKCTSLLNAPYPRSGGIIITFLQCHMVTTSEAVGMCLND